MLLTVLGCHGPYPPAGGACSGYLLQENGFNLLLDCGNGVLSRLQEHLSFLDLHAVLLTHLHADHFSDVLIMRYGLDKAYREGRMSEPLALYAPPGPVEDYSRLPYKNAYRVQALSPGEDLTLGPFGIFTCPAFHPVPTLALRIESASGNLFFSGDSGYDPALACFAAGVDLFLCEANYLHVDLEREAPIHMSAAQAADLAVMAGCGKLVLTHHHPENTLEDSKKEAEDIYPGVLMARESQVFTLGKGQGQ